MVWVITTGKDCGLSNVIPYQIISNHQTQQDHNHFHRSWEQSLQENALDSSNTGGVFATALVWSCRSPKSWLLGSWPNPLMDPGWFCFKSHFTVAGGMVSEVSPSHHLQGISSNLCRSNLGVPQECDGLNHHKASCSLLSSHFTIQSPTVSVPFLTSNGLSVSSSF